MKLARIVRAAWESLDRSERVSVAILWALIGVVALIPLAEGDADLGRVALFVPVAMVVTPFFVVLGNRIKDWFWGGWE